VSTGGSVKTLAASAGDSLLASIRTGNQWGIQELQAGEVISTTKPAITGSPGISSFSPDGALAAFGQKNGSIEVLEWNNPAAEPSSVKAPRGLASMAFSPDGKTLATAHCSSPRSGGLCDKQEIHQWDAASGQETGEAIDSGAGSPTALAYHPDGNVLAVASDNRVVFWNLETRQPVGLPLEGVTARLTSLAFSPDGRLLAAGNADGTITIWDAASGQPIGSPLSGAGGQPLSLAFTPDSLTLYSGSEQGAIYRWDLDPLSWVEHACELAKRDLTPEEITLFLPDANPDFIACVSN
jgi:WD40 repeat protein